MFKEIRYIDCKDKEHYDSLQPPIFLIENICIGEGKYKTTGRYCIEYLNLEQFNLCREVLGYSIIKDKENNNG